MFRIAEADMPPVVLRALEKQPGLEMGYLESAWKVGRSTFWHPNTH
jgi:hypothetical protein